MSIETSLLHFFPTHGSHFKRGDSFLVACSGGPDSVALVQSLKEIEAKLPFLFEIGHVNHKLRGRESEADEKFVKALAKGLGWPFNCATGRVRHLNGNLEEQARVTRYAALWKMARKKGCAGILTAHTLDDQVETVFMNLFRGTGPEGLGGIHPLRYWPNESIPLVRPLLNVSKADVVSFLKERGFKSRKDSTNASEKFLRNWIRRKLLPGIEKRVAGFKRKIGQTAELVRDEQQVWDHILSQSEALVFKPTSSGVLLDLNRLLRYPPATQRRLIRGMIGKDLMTYEGVEGLRRWMQMPPGNGRFWQLRKGWLVERLSKSQGSPSAHLFKFKQNSDVYLKSRSQSGNSKRKV